MTTKIEKVLDRITEDRWIKLATQLIKTGQPSAGDPLDPDLPPGQEEAIAMLVAGKLEAMGMEVNTYESMPRRPNVVGLLKGSGDGPVLMMNDHMDTYPVVEPQKWIRRILILLLLHDMEIFFMPEVLQIHEEIWHQHCWLLKL